MGFWQNFLHKVTPWQSTEEHPLEKINPRNLKHLTHYLHDLIHGKLWRKVLLGLLAGAAVGFLFGPTLEIVSRENAEIIGNWLALPGRFFLTMIQMIVIPLVFASVIRGLAASNNLEQLKKLGSRLVIYFLLTSTIAVTIGIGVASVIQPGKFINNPPASQQISAQEVKQESPSGGDEDGLSLATLPASVISVLPQNPLQEATESQMLQVVLFSIVIGLALVNLQPKQSKPLLDLLGSLQSVAMAVVKWTMYLAPVAVFGLIAQATIQTGIASLIGVGVYVLTVIAGLLAMLLVYLIIAFLAAGISPWTFLSSVKDVQLLAFSTGSSVAVMPLSIQTAEEKLKVRPSISQFIIPVGATVNMDATALFQGAATLFISQMYGLELGLAVLVTIVVTAIGASIGTPATPGVGIVILSGVLSSVGVPLEGLALIIGVDRILEMMRTSVNVTGDLTASVVMNRLVPAHTSPAEEKEQHEQVEKQRQEAEDVIINNEAAA